jgi:hypothetical protein
MSVDTELDAADTGESPALVLVAGGYDPRALATIDWLASRHEVPVYAYTVAMVRFGGERLLTVRREPADPAESGNEVEWLLAGGGRRESSSAPPPRDEEYTEVSPQSSS